MTNIEDIDEQRALLTAFRQTLVDLLSQASQYDNEAFIPPATISNIAKARVAIAHLKATLRAAGVSVDDLRDDEAPPDAPAMHALLLALSDIVGGDKVEGDKVGRDKISIGAIYQYPLAPSSSDPLADALAQLAALPLDHIPEPAPLPHGSRMPLSRNPLFVGRQGDLQVLARALKGGTTAAIGQVAAATGLGGIGKTQLAAEFVHRYGQYFLGGVFWLSFADGAAVAAEVAACANLGALNLPGWRDLPLHEQVIQVRQAWQEAIPRLLVFDNCEDEMLLDAWRPTTGGCRVLVTARRAQWDPTLGVEALALETLSRAESVALLRKFRPDLTVADRDLNAIAAELGDLPLALHLAGSFLARYQDSIAPEAYMAQLRRPTLLQDRSLQIGGRSPTGHDQHVARTFEISYDQLNPKDIIDALALALLARAACCAPGEPIPRLLLQVDEKADDIDASVQLDDALKRLAELGLIDLAAGGVVRLHRLVGMFVRARLPTDDAQVAVEDRLSAIVAILNDRGDPRPVMELQRQLRHATDTALVRADVRAARLCRHLGEHLWRIGDYAAAHVYAEQALAVYERLLGSLHPSTAVCLNNLGLLFQDQGDFAAARPYLERALAIYERVRGPEHPATATGLNNLGMLLQDQGDFAAARPYFERALTIREQVLGPEHPDTAVSLNNLGGLLRDQGDLTGARPYYEQALAIFEQVLGSNHPTTRIVRANLATLDQDRD